MVCVDGWEGGLKVILIKGDARWIPLKDEVVQCVVTSPPYWGLRDYGLDSKGIGLERTPEEYVANIVQVFREVKRVLRKDGTVWCNLGDGYNNRPWGDSATNFNDPKRGRDNAGQAVKQIRNVLTDTLKPKDLLGMPWRVAFALQADGWYLRSDIIWAKPNPMPESVRDRPTKSHEYIFLLSKSPKYYYDQEAVKEPGEMRPQNRFTNGKGPKSSGYAAHRQPTGMTECVSRNLRSVWSIATQPFPGAHFATFPEALAERCIKAGSKAGDVVLDPFGGSGTVALVATALARRVVHIDLTYHKLAREERIATLGKYLEKKAKQEKLLRAVEREVDGEVVAVECP